MNVFVDAKIELTQDIYSLPIAPPAYRFKKAVDIAGAVLALAIIIPFAPFIALLIKLDSRGPVMVRLDRISEGKKIGVYKFRSMVCGAHAMKRRLMHLNERSDGPFFKIKKDPRITRAGKLLRKFRIDEFPQLLNVLRGELSLVGPRPHEPEEVMQYPKEYYHVIFTKAGVTGLSQVRGASSLPYYTELELDSYYVRNTSLGLDLKILAKTAKIMFADPSAV